jgi:hypothetical protein
MEFLVLLGVSSRGLKVFWSYDEMNCQWRGCNGISAVFETPSDLGH